MKKKGKTKTNKNTNFVYDIDYNHYRKRDLNNKKNKIKKNVEPNYSSKDKRIQPKKLTAKVDEYKTSH